MFKVGDLAVYPAQGVGVIEAIEKKEIMGDNQTFYIMKIMGNGMKIMIPTKSAKSVGLREVIKEKEIYKVYDILKAKTLQSISRPGISATENTSRKSKRDRFMKSPKFYVIS